MNEWVRAEVRNDQEEKKERQVAVFVPYCAFFNTKAYSHLSRRRVVPSRILVVLLLSRLLLIFFHGYGLVNGFLEPRERKQDWNAYKTPALASALPSTLRLDCGITTHDARRQHAPALRCAFDPCLNPHPPLTRNFLSVFCLTP